jgi:hypothetical protein
MSGVYYVRDDVLKESPAAAVYIWFSPASRFLLCTRIGAAMAKGAFFQAALSLAIIGPSTITAQSQVRLDVPADTVRRLAKKTYIEDLAVNDTAHIFWSVCIENGALYVPGWTSPADLGSQSYAQTGVVLRITVLPGKKIRGVLVDAAQAQAVAKGKSNEPPSLNPDAYKEAVLDYVNNIYAGGTWGPFLCEDERRLNPLRTLTLYAVESINGFSKISDLLASLSKK